MTPTTKILASILTIGLVYSIYRLFTGEGGSGLEDFIYALIYTSVILFAVSLLILLYNIRRLKRHGDTFIFLLLGLPLTIMWTANGIERFNYNRPVDLTPKYPRPVSEQQYLKDSTTIAVQIDSLVAIRNRETGGPDVVSAFIDTLIYSQTGDKVFVPYIQAFEKNDLGNDLDPAYLFATSRDSIYWNLQEGTPNAYTFGGSFHDLISLKKAVRQFYFKGYSFVDKDSSKENYFWKRRKSSDE